MIRRPGEEAAAVDCEQSDGVGGGKLLGLWLTKLESYVIQEDHLLDEGGDLV